MHVRYLPDVSFSKNQQGKARTKRRCRRCIDAEQGPVVVGKAEMNRLKSLKRPVISPEDHLRSLADKVERSLDSWLHE